MTQGRISGNGDEKHHVTAADVVRLMAEFAPPGLAFDGDSIGLQVGRMNKPVRRILIALDAYPAVIEEAVRIQADMLVTHHAMLFRPLKTIDTASARGLALAQAISADLAVFNAHTNLDIADGGVNDVLAEMFQLQDVEILERTQNEQLRKLVVFVPRDSHAKVLNAVCAAGAGHIGAYSHCTFNTPGTGTFLPGEGTHPYIGQTGKLEQTDEVRLETIVPERMVEKVVRSMLEAHPYEEVAYDLYPLQLMGKANGIGRIGNLPQPTSLKEFAESVKAKLGLAHIRFSGEPDRIIRRVAVLGGSGVSYAGQAIRKQADVLVTADCDHHNVAEANHDGLCIIDATHAALEVPVLTKVAQYLRSTTGVEVRVTTVNEDPFVWV
ncbi:Nif3-like dinuclear metal center hexameric protein [Alicyclobacillus mengziensis]|uniref:GTP cyclohydrolase 1 type 2 homolog n=1 Tax=Alicyclobacillus mengziensis TaxID=2931921 RepID=A0A9X7VWT5_9BACL|nr:Nif3-like dinuclear metal center hexameric protein [Alicyclobacillus mengziensis]QSO46094.1 Nif3-like dinuclear metal center hexameric protein [Alicyclobacillus mengziensis]